MILVLLRVYSHQSRLSLPMIYYTTVHLSRRLNVLVQAKPRPIRGTVFGLWCGNGGRLKKCWQLSDTRRKETKWTGHTSSTWRHAWVRPKRIEATQITQRITIVDPICRQTLRIKTPTALCSPCKQFMTPIISRTRTSNLRQIETTFLTETGLRVN